MPTNCSVGSSVGSREPIKGFPIGEKGIVDNEKCSQRNLASAVMRLPNTENEVLRSLIMFNQLQIPADV